MGNRRGAVDAGNDGDVIARSHAAPRPKEPLERPHLFLGIVLYRPDLSPDFIAAGEIAHGQVVCMNKLAGRDGLAGKANHLAILAHRRVLGQGAHGDLVAGWNRVQGCQDGRIEAERSSGFNGAFGDGDVVFIAELKSGCIGIREGHR